MAIPGGTDAVAPGDHHRLHDLIAASPSPRIAAITIEDLFDAQPGLAERVDSDPGLAKALVAVLSYSRFFSRLCRRDPRSIEVLANLDKRVDLEAMTGGEGHPQGVWNKGGSVGETSNHAIADWKNLEMLRIAARDLLGLDDFETVAASISDVAIQVIASLWDRSGLEEVCIVGMGKLGGKELNYSSDIDIILVGEGVEPTDPALSHMLAEMRSCWRIDLGLRPEGRAGALVRPLDAYLAYWERWAQPWEFQALLKATPIAGEEQLSKRFIEAVEQTLWGRAWRAEDIHQLRVMKQRYQTRIRPLFQPLHGEDWASIAGLDIKHGPGGIRDVEFAVQLLQLVHGRADPSLRTPNTLKALEELAGGGYVSSEDAESLKREYKFLRTVEHRLQLVEMAQVHTLPSDKEALVSLAKSLGKQDTPQKKAITSLVEEIQGRLAATRMVHERLWYRPLLDAFSITQPTASQVTSSSMSNKASLSMPLSKLTDRLVAFGFSDTERTKQALLELTKGFSRSSRLLQQMLALLLEWLSVAPDPDLGLIGLRRLGYDDHARGRMEEVFRDSPEAARRLCQLLGTSKTLMETITKEPDIISELADDSMLIPTHGSSVEELSATAKAAMQLHAQTTKKRATLRRWYHREVARIAMADILGLSDLRTTGESLANLAEATIQAALSETGADESLALIALGRFAGKELSYASDVDVVLVGLSDSDEGQEQAERFIKFIGADTEGPEIITLDLDLRPEGRAGPLVRSMSSYRAYLQRWALTWERQAWLRARPLATNGMDEALLVELKELSEEFVWNRPFGEEEVREIRRMKARVEHERIPARENPEFHLKLGKGALTDIEWTVQLLQLLSGVRSPSTMEALESLVGKGTLDVSEAEALANSYSFCEMVRNRRYLMLARREDYLPASPDELSKLARSLERTSGQLREEYKRVTRRALAVVERRFWGR